jgi:hypothetical protein
LMVGGRRGRRAADFEISTNKMCRAYGAWVFGVVYPALTGWASFCRASGATERSSTGESFNYSKWIKTISGAVQTRRGGPQVPAPLEV